MTVLPATPVADPERFLVPAKVARARRGLWLVELSDGTYSTAFGDRIDVTLAAPLPVDEIERDALAEHAVMLALDLAARVRADRTGRVWARLAQMSGQSLVALAIALAAMVPTDRTADQLLAWTEGEQQ
jgi:hypothetical protein